MEKEGNWWEGFFGDLLFSSFFLHRDEAKLSAEKNFLMKVLCLKLGAVLFDQCSGLGNISLALAREGVKTIGVDQSAEYVRVAKDGAEKENLPSEFFQDDALVFLPSVKCDAAINWYTSFGYSLDDDTNIKMLKLAFESLKEGAYFALDFHNLPFVLKQPKETEQVKTNDKGEQCTVKREAIFNLEKGSYLSRWTYKYPDGTIKQQEGETRIYLPHQLKSMLLGVGFKNIKFYGGVDESPLSVDSSRCIVVAQK